MLFIYLFIFFDKLVGLVGGGYVINGALSIIFIILLLFKLCNCFNEGERIIKAGPSGSK